MPAIPTGNIGMTISPGLFKLIFEYGNLDSAVTTNYPNGIITNNNIVCFMGSLTINNSVNWTIGHKLFDVPANAYPTKAYLQFFVPLIKSGGSYTDWIPAVLRVRTNGDVTLQRPLDAGTWYLYLNGLCYSVNQNYYAYNPNA